LKSHLLPSQAEKEGEVDRVYRMLKKWILECELPPGDFLSEVDLARRCNTSRTPVREACNRLSQEKWISRIRHKGYLVPPISIREIVEVYEFRKLLECFAAERVAQIASTEQIAEIARIIEIETAPAPDLSEIVEANERFHLRLAEIAGNQRLLDQLQLTLEYVRRLDIYSTRRDSSWIPHRDIVSALQSRKPAAARQTMAAHIDHSRDRMLKLFGG
jgi:DNA-binding GntR family transcriptional regulator